MKKVHLFFALAFFLGVILSLYYYPRLPDRIAVHFNASGSADGWGARDHFFLIIDGAFAFLVVLLGGLPLLLRHIPASLINLPNRDYWLDPERKDATLDRLTDQLLFFGAMTLFLMDGIMYLSFTANLSKKPAMSSELLWSMIVGFIIVNVGWTIYLIRSLRLPAQRLQDPDGR
jgi:uncharacterized membrane protein